MNERAKRIAQASEEAKIIFPTITLVIVDGKQNRSMITVCQQTVEKAKETAMVQHLQEHGKADWHVFGSVVEGNPLPLDTTIPLSVLLAQRAEQQQASNKGINQMYQQEVEDFASLPTHSLAALEKKYSNLP
jgi:hypothetical protein